MSEPTRQYEDAYLWTPADRVRLAELREDLSSVVNTASAMAMADAPQTMDEDAPEAELRAAAAAIDEFVTEAKSRARVVRMIALPRRKWRALKDAHPVRMVTTKTTDAEGVESSTEKPNEADERHGFNVESIADELVAECLDPSAFDTPGQRADFLDDLSEPDFDTLYGAALRVNIGGFAPPKAEFSSQVDRIIVAISNSHETSD